MVLLCEVRLVLSPVLAFRFCLFFAAFTHTDLLRSSSDSVRRITDNRIKNWSFWLQAASRHIKTKCTDVHRHEIRHWHSVVLKVCVDVKLFDFVQSFNALVQSLSANTVAF